MDDVVIAAHPSANDGLYLCYNCAAPFPIFKRNKKTKLDPSVETLTDHLKASPRCSLAIRAYIRSHNSDCLDLPPVLRR